jgi:hypothetical protein
MSLLRARYEAIKDGELKDLNAYSFAWCYGNSSVCVSQEMRLDPGSGAAHAHIGGAAFCSHIDARARLNAVDYLISACLHARDPRTSDAGESWSTIAGAIVSRDPKRGGREGTKVAVASMLR